MRSSLLPIFCCSRFKINYMDFIDICSLINVLAAMRSGTIRLILDIKNHAEHVSNTISSQLKQAHNEYNRVKTGQRPSSQGAWINNRNKLDNTKHSKAVHKHLPAGFTDLARYR